MICNAVQPFKLSFGLAQIHFSAVCQSHSVRNKCTLSHCSSFYYFYLNLFILMNSIFVSCSHNFHSLARKCRWFGLYALNMLMMWFTNSFRHGCVYFPNFHAACNIIWSDAPSFILRTWAFIAGLIAKIFDSSNSLINIILWCVFECAFLLRIQLGSLLGFWLFAHNFVAVFLHVSCINDSLLLVTVNRVLISIGFLLFG